MLRAFHEIKREKRSAREKKKIARKFIGSGICFDNNLRLLLWFWFTIQSANYAENLILCSCMWATTWCEKRGRKKIYIIHMHAYLYTQVIGKTKSEVFDVRRRTSMPHNHRENTHTHINTHRRTTESLFFIFQRKRGNLCLFHYIRYTFIGTLHVFGAHWKYLYVFIRGCWIATNKILLYCDFTIELNALLNDMNDNGWRI